MSRAEKVEELLARWDELREQGQEVSAEELAADSPELLDELKGRIQRLRAMDWLDRPVNETPGSSNGQAGPGMPIPATIGGRYRLERLIAEGGFGQVWRATDTALQRPVAVKVTTLECVSEARRVASLKHHGIVSVHDVGHEGNHCFIVFDLVEGTDLARRIRDSRPGWEGWCRPIRAKQGKRRERGRFGGAGVCGESRVGGRRRRFSRERRLRPPGPRGPDSLDVKGGLGESV